MLLDSNIFFLLLAFKELWTRKRYIEKCSLCHTQILLHSRKLEKKILK